MPLDGAMGDQRESIRKKIHALEQKLHKLKQNLLTVQPEFSLPLEALVMQVAGCELALPVDQVEEVVRMVLVSPLPDGPSSVRGIITYRGQVVPVVDLRVTLSGKSASMTPDMFLVLSSADTRTFALAVDSVDGVHIFGEQDIESASEISTQTGPVMVFIPGQPQPVALLDSRGLLTASEIDSLDELLRGVDDLEDLS